MQGCENNAERDPLTRRLRQIICCARTGFYPCGPTFRHRADCLERNSQVLKYRKTGRKIKDTTISSRESKKATYFVPNCVSFPNNGNKKLLAASGYITSITQKISKYIMANNLDMKPRRCEYRTFRACSAGTEKRGVVDKRSRNDLFAHSSSASRDRTTGPANSWIIRPSSFWSSRVVISIPNSDLAVPAADIAFSRASSLFTRVWDSN